MRNEDALRKARSQRTVTVILVLLTVIGLIVLSFGAVYPQDSGKKKKDGALQVDAGNAADGYIRVTGGKNKKRYKLRIAKGETTLTYDLNNSGEWEIFPLQLGSGSYTVTLYKNSSGKKYSQEGRITVKAQLNREDAAYLCPNQYVNYDEKTPVVSVADELCANLSTDREKFDAICDYVQKNFIYDLVKALTVESGSLPDISGCFDKKMGICQDLSAMTVCMLRTQNIPARLVIGYVDHDNYHAWLEATVDGENRFFDPTVAVGGLSKQSVYNEERSY